MSQVSLLLPGPPSTVVRSESFEHRAPVDRKERASNHSNPKAKAALDKERDKLIKQGCWDYSSVREWRDVSNEAISRTLGAKLLMLAASLISVSRRTPNFRSPIRIESSKARTKAITGRFSPRSPLVLLPWRPAKPLMLLGFCLVMKFRLQAVNLHTRRPSRHVGTIAQGVMASRVAW